MFDLSHLIWAIAIWAVLVVCIVLLFGQGKDCDCD